MQSIGPYLPFKVISYVVLTLMLAAICYAGYISIMHWSGIGV